MHPRTTRPFSYIAGSDDFYHLQEQEHTGEIYPNAYVGAVYHGPWPPQHESPPVPLTSPLFREVHDPRPESSTTLATLDCIEPVTTTPLPHTSQADPLQRQQHATEVKFFKWFAAGADYGPVAESSQPHTAPEPSVSADDNGRYRHVKDPLP
jgi:hypothetical protein